MTPTYPTINNGRCGRQRGAALLVSMIVLLVMTVLGVTASRTSAIQERMTANMRNKALAFEAAETALRDAENYLEGLIGGVRPTPVAPANCPSSPCPILTPGSLNPMAEATWDGNNVQTGQKLADTAEAYRYFIRRQQVVRESSVVGRSTDERAQIFYEVHGHGVGGDDSAVSILRSTYVLRF